LKASASAVAPLTRAASLVLKSAIKAASAVMVTGGKVAAAAVMLSWMLWASGPSSAAVSPLKSMMALKLGLP